MKIYFTLLALSCIPLLRLLALEMYQWCCASLKDLVHKQKIQH
ncbi:hypothetical protein ACIPF8_00025 [Collimonas sp. NPDC087041]